MSGQASTVGSKIALDAMSGRATVTARTTYVVLLTSAPSDATTMANMAEVFAPGASGYARQAATWSDPGGTEATSNTSTLTFGPFSGDPASVTHMALVSASTGTSGDFIFYWTCDTAKDAGVGDSITIAASALVMGAE